MTDEQQENQFFQEENEGASYGDMMGEEMPASDYVVNPGEVELSVPQKWDYVPPVARSRKKEEKPQKVWKKPEPAEMVFEEPEVDDEGVALTIPPQTADRRNAEDHVRPLYAAKPAGVGIDVLNENFGEDNGDGGIDAASVTITDFENMPESFSSSPVESEAETAEEPEEDFVADEDFVSGEADGVAAETAEEVVADDEVFAGETENAVEYEEAEVSLEPAVVEEAGNDDSLTGESARGAGSAAVASDEVPDFIHGWNDNDDTDDFLDKILSEDDTGDDFLFSDDLTDAGDMPLDFMGQDEVVPEEKTVEKVPEPMAAVQNEETHEAEYAAAEMPEEAVEMAEKQAAETVTEPEPEPEIEFEPESEAEPEPESVVETGAEEAAVVVDENAPAEEAGETPAEEISESGESVEAVSVAEGGAGEAAEEVPSAFWQAVYRESSEIQNDEDVGEEAVYYFNKQSGIQKFVAEKGRGVIVLSSLDYARNELDEWNLVFLDSNWHEVPRGTKKLDIPMMSASFRVAEVVQSGLLPLRLYDKEEFEFETLGNAPVRSEGKIISGIDSDRAVVVTDVIHQQLSTWAGKELNYNYPRTGMLAGPKGALLYFAGVIRIVIPSGEEIKRSMEENYKYFAKRYAGNLSDGYAKYTAADLGGEFTATSDRKSVYLSVGHSTYGWSVRFDSGLVMSLNDIREFQLRNGRLPQADGIISYGNKQLRFRGCDRIVVYAEAEYFSYR